MSKQADLLQESLERLEIGETLEDFQRALPAEDIPSLSLVSRLRTAAWPRRDPQAVNKQRGQIIALYNQEAGKDSVNRPWFNLFNDWRLPATISVAMVMLLVCGLVTIISLRAIWISTSQQVSLFPLLKTDIAKLVEKDETPDSAVEPPDSVTDPSELASELSQPLPPYESLAVNEALLVDFRGLVEIQVGESWQIVSEDTILTAGTDLRTKSFSSASLTFKDGSLTQIGPNSELSIENLSVDPDKGIREIVLMQGSGESSHDVVPLENATGKYQVSTPSGQGQVKGTQFHVRVASEQTSWLVDSGAVEVSGAETVVQVGAGQMTSVSTDGEPTNPVEFITGQGIVNAVGDNWEIDGQTYKIHVQTIFVGNPQVGDLVFYEGHLEDGNRVADLIALVRRNPANTFTLTGIVTIKSDTIWEVNGEDIYIPPDVDKDGVTDGGVLVRVKGIILPNDVDPTKVIFQAEEIRLLPDDNDAPFEFAGVVQQIDDENNQWMISDIQVDVDEDTYIDEGLDVGAPVLVKGWILDNGTWLASSITRYLDQDKAFEFVGYIESVNPWQIAGINLITETWTTIDPLLEVGDLARVSGQIQHDGKWLAFEIQGYDEALLTILVGRVYSKNPWVVSGLKLNVDKDTDIVGDIVVGTLVRVEMQLLADGTQKVLRIEPFDGFDWELACQSVVVTVISIDGDQIVLDSFQVLSLSEGTQIQGEIKPGSLVKTVICYDEDMNVILVSIVVLENPKLPPPDYDDEKDEYDDDKIGGKVKVCHNRDHNPHTIEIARSALKAHLAHGDTLGACEGE